MKRILIPFIITLVFLSGIRNIWYSLPFRYIELHEEILNRTFNISDLALHHAFSIVSGVLMIVIAAGLVKRSYAAWIISIFAALISITGHLIHIHTLTPFYIFMDISLILLLVFNKSHFRRMPLKHHSFRAILYFASAFFVIFCYYQISVQLLHQSFNITTNGVFQLILLKGQINPMQASLGVKIFNDTIVFIFWAFVIGAIILLMGSNLNRLFTENPNVEKVRSLVLKFGFNPMSYLSLENDKLYFFSKDVEGVCSYTIVGNVMAVCGDIICSESDANEFMLEVTQFADENALDLLLMNITDEYIHIYKNFGFGFLKCGEDANFNLSDYSLKGGAVAKVRAAINHAVKDGIYVKEIDMAKEESRTTIEQMEEISKKWLRAKDSPELIFMLGKNNFDTPYNRRYFCAIDSEDKVNAYVMFNPYLKGYIAEITRRDPNGKAGAIEMIIYEAFMKFKEEGYTECTMGLSPLYNVSSNDNPSVNEKVFTFLYDHMTQLYDFKSLHHAKEKFAPTSWESRYYAFMPKPFSISFASAIIRSQIPYNILDLIKFFIDSKRKELR